MKKGVLIVVILLLLCCCFSAFAGIFGFGYFENAGKCVYKGPFSTVSTGACASIPYGNDGIKVDDNSNNNGNNSDDSNNNDDNSISDDTRTYNGADGYSFKYSAGLTIDDSNPDRVFVYAENESDNLNISTESTKISPTQTNCELYAQQTMDELVDYDPVETSVEVTTIGGLKTCSFDFTADYGTSSGVVSQRQYYISDGNSTHILTITINDDVDNFETLNDVALSFQGN